VSCTATQSYTDESEAAICEDGDVDDGATDKSGAEELIEDEPYVRTPTPIQAPHFISRIKDAKVKKGQQAIFECMVPESKGVCVKW
jgi:hypothetical protein